MVSGEDLNVKAFDEKQVMIKRHRDELLDGVLITKGNGIVG